MLITNDFETRSKVDLKKAGVWAYAEDESTEAFCWAFKVDDEPPLVWINPYFKDILPADFLEELPVYMVTAEDIQYWIDGGAIFEAHNAEFERAVFTHVMSKHNWPTPPLRQWRCSAAKAATYSLPRALDNVAEVLELEERKDKEGHSIMLRLSKPKLKGGWDETPEKIFKLLKYCVQDVVTEHGVSKAIPDLSTEDQEVWFMDQTINSRGVNIDVDSVKAVIEMVKSEQAHLTEECTEIAGCRPTQVKPLGEWVTSKGYDTPNLQAATVSKLLENETLDPSVRRVLEIRQQCGKTSVGKFVSMLNGISKDGRARGLHMFNGANTGRWTGVRIQLQNALRQYYEDAQRCIDLVKEKRYETVKMLYDKPIIAASKLVRSMVQAAPGNYLIAADYSSIEGRVLAWLAEEENILEAYRKDLDLYKVAYSDAFSVGYDTVSKNQRSIGKVIELACGFQGFWRAYMKMAKNYKVRPPEGVVVDEIAKKMEVLGRSLDEKEMLYFTRDFNNHKLSKSEAAFKVWTVPFLTRWRENRPKTVALWKNLQKAAFEAIRNPGIIIQVGKLALAVSNIRGRRFLQMQLPSGRLLNYYDPRVAITKEKEIKISLENGEIVEQKVEVVKKTLSYMGVSSKNNQWSRIHTYGGKLTENAAQAVANDFFRFGMQNHERAGYPLIFHVHDEDITEMPLGQGSLTEFKSLMARLPAWAKDFPMGVEGFITDRYKKG